MICALLGGIAAIPWAWTALRCGAMALTVLLFLLALRRSGNARADAPYYSRNALMCGKFPAAM